MGFHRASDQPRLLDFSKSIESQTSMQSQASDAGLLSHMSTLGFLPSLSSFFSDLSSFDGVMDHRCIFSIRCEQGSHISSLAVVGDYLYAGCTGSSTTAAAASGSRNSIRVWQKMTMKECAGFGAGYAAVKALVVADGRILSAHQDRKIRIWSLDKAPALRRLRPKQVSEGDIITGMRHEGAGQLLQAVNAQENSHKLLASMPTVRDYLKSFLPPKNYVQVRRHHKRLWIEHVDTISMLAVGGTVADPLLYSASWDRTIKVWKLLEFKCIESFKAHDDAINALVVSADGFLYTASADAKVKVWGRPCSGSNTTGEGQQQKQTKQKHSLLATLEAHKSAVNALSLMKESDGSRSWALYSGGCDRGIVVWEREDGTQHMAARGVLRGHRNAILCMVSMGNILCSGSADRTIRVWRRSGALAGSVHSCIALLQGHGGPVKCLSLSCGREGDYLLYSSSLDHLLKLWELSGTVSVEEGNGKNDEGDVALAEENVSPWKFNSF